LSSGVPVKSDEHRAGQNLLHRFVQLARLRAMALIHEHEQVALGFEVRRQRLGFISAINSSASPSVIPAFFAPNLWISEQISHGFVAFSVRHQIRAACRAIDASLTPLNTFSICSSSFHAIGDNQHPGIGDVLANPLRQPDHDQALAAALRVPDDAALAPLTYGWAARTPKYWLCRHSFFTPASNTMKSWINSRNRSLPQSWSSPRSSGFSIVIAGLLPLQVRYFSCVWIVP
jgi:hypothetical protein